MCSMEIIKKHIAKNFTNIIEEKQYIVIHDTANYNRGADAMAHYKYFNTANRNASAHYFVDDNSIVELIDPNLRAWHCGDKKGSNITNKNSIGIELCVNKDGNYTLTKQNSIELITKLMIDFNITPSRVVRHFDVTGKVCPASMAQKDWKIWNEYKEEIIKKYNSKKKKKTWKQKEIQKLIDNNLVQDKNWINREDEKVEFWAIAVIVNNLLDKVECKS